MNGGLRKWIAKMGGVSSLGKTGKIAIRFADVPASLHFYIPRTTRSFVGEEAKDVFPLFFLSFSFAASSSSISLSILRMTRHDYHVNSQKQYFLIADLHPPFPQHAIVAWQRSCLPAGNRVR